MEFSGVFCVIGLVTQVFVGDLGSCQTLRPLLYNKLGENFINSICFSSQLQIVSRDFYFFFSFGKNFATLSQRTLIR